MVRRDDVDARTRSDTCVEKEKVRRSDKRKRSDVFLVDETDVSRILRAFLEDDTGVIADLEALFSALDDMQVVFLDGMPDARIRKKLRHLFRALSVNEVVVKGRIGWRKSSKKREPLKKVVRMICLSTASDINRRIDSVQGQEKRVTADMDSPVHTRLGSVCIFLPSDSGCTAVAGRCPSRIHSECNTSESNRMADNENVSRLPTVDGMTERPVNVKSASRDGYGTEHRVAAKQKHVDDPEAEALQNVVNRTKADWISESLRELNESGQFVGARNDAEEWNRKVCLRTDRWGKRAHEQGLKDKHADVCAQYASSKRDYQPWQHFDRERDLQGRGMVTMCEYNHLVEESYKLRDRFRSAG